MIKLFPYIFISVILISCIDSSINLSHTEKILNKGLEQTDKLISEELNIIERSFVNGIELEQKDIFNRIKKNSNQIDSISNSLFDSPQNIKHNIPVLKNSYSNHINLLLSLTNNDARVENDYLVPTFKSIIEDKVGYQKLQSSFVNLDLANQFDSIINTGNDQINSLNLKIIYSQIKKAQHKTFSCLATYLQGFGIKSHKFEGFVKLDKNSSNDTLTGKIISGAIPKYSINKFHFGQIDSIIFKNNATYWNYPPGYKHKVPLIGDFQTFSPIEGNKFKTHKSIPIEGIVEIRHAKGTIYIPFKK